MMNRTQHTILKHILRFTVLLLLLAGLYTGAASAEAAPAAAIGQSRYDTLQEAINAAQNGDVITLLQNVTEDVFLPGYTQEGDLRTDSLALTIDLDYYTLASANGSSLPSFVHIANGCSVTMKNGTLTGVSRSKQYTVYVGNGSFTGENLTFANNTPYYRNGYVGGAITAHMAKDPYTTATNTSAALSLMGCTFTGNDVSSSGTGGAGAILAYASGTATLPVSIEDCVFTGNTGSRYAAIYFFAANNRNASLQMSDSTFSQNSVTSKSSASVIGTSGMTGMNGILYGCNVKLTDVDIIDNNATALYSLGMADLSGCNILNNTSPCTSMTAGGLYLYNSYGKAATVTLTDCRIAGNSATGGTSGAGGIMLSNYSSVNLNNTVITGNNGSKIGGLYYAGTSSSITVSLTSPGAIYGNQYTGTGSSEQDLFFQNKPASPNKVQFAAAPTMKDGAIDFSGYAWVSALGNSTSNLTNVFKGFSYSAKPARATAVAAIGTVTYTTVQSAIDAAQPGDTIRLIAGESDNSSKTIAENISVNKQVTIDLNGRTLTSGSGSIITVQSAGSLTLTGSGFIPAAGATPAITNQGSLILRLNNNAEIGSIRTATSSVQLYTNAQLGDITLAEGCTLTAAGSVTGPLNLILSKDILAKLNSGLNDEIIPLILPADSPLTSLAANVSIEGGSTAVAIRTEANGSIVAQGQRVPGVFLNGLSGNDSNSGTTAATAVRTFEKAKQLLAETGLDVIYITGTVSVRDTAAWSLPEGKSLLRHPTFTSDLISVTGALTLQNIVLDGNGGAVQAQGPLAQVKSGGTITLAAGAVLKNNNHRTASNDTYGGGVSVSQATLVLEGGTITGCYAMNGGGVYGQYADIIIRSGSIDGNSAGSPDYTTQGAGGGICVNYSTTISMTGGSITGNTSDNWGGGIALGIAADPQNPCVLNLTGGTINDNHSANSGGGIFVQCESTANVSGGEITNNHSSHGMFAGGGIYVNGGRPGYRDGWLVLKNAIVTENIAERGGGYAGCETSTLSAFTLSTAAFYGNEASERGNELYTGTGFSSNAGAASLHLTEHMLGGGAYNWEDETGRRLSSPEVNALSGSVALNSNPSSASIQAALTASVLANGVVIQGNSADGWGGGIGSNGTVLMGDEAAELTIPVTKRWQDEGNTEALITDTANNRYLLPVVSDATIHPMAFKVWLLRNGERVSHLDFQREIVEMDGVRYYAWPISLSFQRQPANDPSGAPYLYAIEEEMPTGANYISSISGNVSGFELTNRYIASSELALTARKTVNGNAPAAGETFRFTLSGNGITETVSNNGEEIRFSPMVYITADIGSEFVYRLTEEAVSGYQCDASVYQITVTVLAAADGTPNPVISQIHRDGTPSGEILFRNLRTEAAPTPTPAPLPSVPPQTGDNSLPELSLLLCIASLLGLCLLRSRGHTKRV